MVKANNEIRISRRARRRKAVRKSLAGTSARPRLAVFRSLKHIYAQIIDDNAGRTLCSMSSRAKDFAPAAAKKKCELSFEVGLGLGKKALALGISTVAFDRSGYKYHGRIRALADGARKAGLVF